jgi:hypothetical protein
LSQSTCCLWHGSGVASKGNPASLWKLWSGAKGSVSVCYIGRM